MPYERPTLRAYAVATQNHQHGDAVIYNGFAGIALKQKAVSSGAAAGAATQAQIATGESFAIQIKGECQVPVSVITGSPTIGVPIYITAAHVLTTTATSNSKFGRVKDVAGTRGVPTGRVRIDLEAKDSF